MIARSLPTRIALPIACLGFALAMGPLACNGTEGGFGGSGSGYNGTGDEDSDDGSDTDTEDGDAYPEGWPEPQDEDGPSLELVDAHFEEYANIGTVIYIEVPYFDPQDDVVGGDVVITVDGGEYDNVSTPETDILTRDDPDAFTAWADGGVLTFVVSPVYDFETYDLEVLVRDKRGNRSNVAEGTCRPE